MRRSSPKTRSPESVSPRGGTSARVSRALVFLFALAACKSSTDRAPTPLGGSAEPVGNLSPFFFLKDASAPSLRGTDVRSGAVVAEERGSGVGEMIADTAFQDIDKKPGKLSGYRGKTLVVVMWSSTCPVANKYLPTLRDLSEKVAKDPKSALLVVLPEAQEDAEKARAALEGIPARVVVGDGIARALRAKASTESFVVDAAGTLQYRGAIDDQYAIGAALPAPRSTYLNDALAAVAKGERPPVRVTYAPGCALGVIKAMADEDRDGGAPTAAPTTNATWYRDVSRIVQDRCQGCHRQGQAAPFALSSYADMKAHLTMIDEVVEARIMPPWFARSGSWKNDLSLTEAQRTTLLQWIRAGAPAGDPKDAPLPRKYPSEFTIGEPDAVVPVADPTPVPDRGILPYRYLVLHPNFTEDRFVQLVELHPSAPQIVHHAQIFVLPPGPGDAVEPTEADLAAAHDARRIFAALVPGGDRERFTPDEGRFLPKGARLLLQVHYQPNGHAVAKSSFRLGLVFNKTPPEKVLSAMCVVNFKIKIPPNEKDHKETVAMFVPQRTEIVRFVPHMHLRGKRMTYTEIDPDGSRHPLFDGDYDFRWQLTYEPAAPLVLDAGSRIEVTATYDNTKGNTQNPDPNATVTYGQQTTDEMDDGCMVVAEPRLAAR